MDDALPGPAAHEAPAAAAAAGAGTPAGGHRLHLPARSAGLARHRAQRLAWVVGANVAVAALELGGGLAAHSMALFADAAHNAADIAAAILALMAVQLAQRPPTAAKSFGYHRSGVLAAEVNAGLVLVISVLVAVGAIARLAHPVPTRGGLLAAVAGAALLLNLAGAAALHERGGHELNIRGAMLHLGADAAASAGALLAGLVLLARPAWGWVDPAVSLAIAALVAAQAVRLGRQVADVLLEGTPASTDMGRLAAAVAAMPGVEDVHDLHVWSLSSEVTLLSAHLVLAGHPTLEGAQAVAGAVRARLAAEFAIAHATLELECEACTLET